MHALAVDQPSPRGAARRGCAKGQSAAWPALSSRMRLRSTVWSFARLLRYQLARQMPPSRHARTPLTPNRSWIQRASSCGVPTSELFCNHLLQDVLIQCEISHQALEPCILIFEQPQFTQLAYA